MLGSNHFSAPAVNALPTKGRKVAVDATSQLTGGSGGTYEVEPYTTVVLAHANTDMGSITVELPAVSEGEGMVITIQATIADSKTVTVADQDDSAGWSDITLDADGEYVVLYSDGFYWHELVTGYS